jgi:hypothetical protein
VDWQSAGHTYLAAMLTNAQADAEDKARGPEPTPPLGSWKAMYIAVMVIQLLMAMLFVWFQNAYA